MAQRWSKDAEGRGGEDRRGGVPALVGGNFAGPQSASAFHRLKGPPDAPRTLLAPAGSGVPTRETSPCPLPLLSPSPLPFFLFFTFPGFLVCFSPLPSTLLCPAPPGPPPLALLFQTSGLAQGCLSH